MNKNTMKNALKFRKFLEDSEINEVDFAALICRTPRCVNFYVNGERNIPKEVWVKIYEFRDMKKEDLWKLVVKRRRGIP